MHVHVRAHKHTITHTHTHKHTHAHTGHTYMHTFTPTRSKHLHIHTEMAVSGLIHCQPLYAMDPTLNPKEKDKAYAQSRTLLARRYCNLLESVLYKLLIAHLRAVSFWPLGYIGIEACGGREVPGSNLTGLQKHFLRTRYEISASKVK